MKERFFVIGLLLFAFVYNATSQKKATVRSFIQTADHISGADRRNDLNGTPCALVKVQVVDDISRVEGNRIGEVVNKGVEKWVYMCKGSRNMKIHLTNHLPVKVMFQDYKINGLESNRVYELVIDANGSDPIARQRLVINYTPIDATVIVDNKLFKGNGRIELNLPVGDHNYTIAAEGYVTAESTIRLNKDAPREITERLLREKDDNKSEQPEVPMSSDNVIVGLNGNLLTLKVKPFYAKIRIDGKAYDADNNGELTVPLFDGQHQINAEAEGFKPVMVNVNIRAKKSGTKKIKLSKQKDTGSVKFKKGMMVMNEDANIKVGKNGNVLIIKAKPTDGLKLTIDSIEYKQNSLFKVKTLAFYLPYGTHEIKAECKGYVTAGLSVNIGQSKVTRNVKLKKIKKSKRTSVMPYTNSNMITPGQNGNELLIFVKPVFANIDIDGNKYLVDSKGRQIINLPYGIHKISVVADGFYSEQATVNIGKKTAKKKIKLKKIPSKKRKSK